MQKKKKEKHFDFKDLSLMLLVTFEISINYK